MCTVLYGFGSSNLLNVPLWREDKKRPWHLLVLMLVCPERGEGSAPENFMGIYPCTSSQTFQIH